ncbi:lysophospholipid acyltransferase family protein [Actinopolymorpha sp. B11F2]|uniref:lysophospholipid acyltransferase family protein n=1 Tax=Actinopolymorpha sp. B11F2 TaxID=3160862 RepID=UPI0032E4595C
MSGAADPPPSPFTARPSSLSAYWRGTPGPPDRPIRLTRRPSSGVLKLAWSIRVHDRHHVPGDGPVILASNHLAILDGPVLAAAMARPVHALVKKEMFRGLLGKALRRLGQIPVDRGTADVGALKAALAVLDRGDVLAIYPEGKRGPGDFTVIKPGVAYLALCTGAPVVPVACLGTRALGKSTGAVPSMRTRIDVVFGRPLVLEAVPWPRRREVVRQQASRLRQALIAHLREAVEVSGRAAPGAEQEAGPREAAAPTPGRIDVEEVS